MSKNQKLKWRETVIDTELLSEFSKYGVSMIEEIEDPSGTLIYDLGIGNTSKQKNKMCKNKANLESEKMRYNDTPNDMNIMNNKENNSKNSEIDNLNNKISKKRKGTNRNENINTKKKKEKTSIKQKECVADPEEYWEEYYELKEKLYEWTKNFDKSMNECETIDINNNDYSMKESEFTSLVIHPSILKGLSNLGFLKPTPIQESCLIPAIRDRKDIIGAAETGSGKTLAYGIPIIVNIMFTIQRRREKNETKALKDFENAYDFTESNENNWDEEKINDIAKDEVVMELESLGFQTTNVIDTDDKFAVNENKKNKYKSNEELHALVVLPSRELAIQVRDHLKEVGKYTGLGIHAFVGGLSIEKQERLVIKKNVQIAIGTPGRLSALILEDNFNYEKNSRVSDSVPKRESYVKFNLDELRYLVLDEADRLVEQGHYRELRDILQYIYKTDKKSKQVIRKIQTYLFSATLTLPNYLHPKFSKLNQKNNSKKQIGNKKYNDNIDNKIYNSVMSENSNKAVESLLQYIKLRENQVFVVDLSRFKTNTNKETTNIERVSKIDDKSGGIIKLPKGLTISMIKCEADEIEMRLVLYLLLLFSPKWLPPCKNKVIKNNATACNTCPVSINNSKLLLFVNSISYVYRLVPLLSLTLVCKDLHQKDLPFQKKNKTKCRNNCFGSELKIIGIHGNMSQKQRILSIEAFRSSNSAILVCTDVLARGLDIENVDVVVHLQPPRNVSLMIHRSGRTARASREGECVIFCTPKDVMSYSKSLKAVSLSIESISVPFQMKSVVSSQVSHVQQRLELANEIEKIEHNVLRKKKNNSWMINKANEADLELSDQEEYSITPEQIKTIQSLSQKRKYLLEFAKAFQKFY
ncbi:Mak5 pre-mRNA splicing RNA SFII helicase [Cryptosporidium bovis]|uniref:Mak5 pre-mRNA splicing RNA SFII helicase n=1 Tax=Cryptosporidium bovis TaxID=310047 RepID=UPI00351AAC8F|nr:Mak5 pre-mRNA splicing RNA SFII helicase [Cryptosporidium bovis]